MARAPFTNTIKTLRFLADEMTQADLGDRVGVTRQTIAAIEQGKYSPSLDLGYSAERLAELADRGVIPNL